MPITQLHPIIRKFFDTLTFARDNSFALIDLRIVAIGQAQIEIDSLNPTEKELCYKGFLIALPQLENLNLIYKYEILENGFKIYPQNKVYIDENHLKLYFNKEQKNDIA